MDTLLQDLRFSLRSLRRSPGFTMVAALCLALGIGVNATVYSIVDAILLRPLPFAEPERLVALTQVDVERGRNTESVAYANFVDWRERSRSFEQMAGFDNRSMTLGGGEEPERIVAGLVSWNLFATLGVQPALGRGFRADEDRPGAPGVIVLGDELWRRRYGADPSVVGHVVQVNGAPYTIVGVMPREFRFVNREEAWTPIGPVQHASPRTSRELGVVARLRPGVSLARARGELAAVARQLEAEHPAANRGWASHVRPFRDSIVSGDTDLVVWTMMGAVTFVLLIACANVANLQLSRGVSRAREIALRAALGAGRGRIARQLLTESIVLALLSAPMGVALAWWGMDLVASAVPQQDPIPTYLQWRLDGRVLLYAVVVSLLTGVLFGLAPALQASRRDLQRTLREAGARGAGGGRQRLRGALVVAEVALSLVLLVGASLFVRSFLNAQRVGGGFDTRPLMTIRFYMFGERYGTDGARARRVDDVVRRVEALPGVAAATASNQVPLGGGGDVVRVAVEGRPAPAGQEPTLFFSGVTAHWLRTLGVPLAAGRDFTDAEGRDSSGVAIVNRTMARQLWPGAGPAEVLGRRFRVLRDRSGQWITVVGIVPDIADDQKLPGVEPTPSAYVPYPYVSTRSTALIVRVRASGAGGAADPASVAPAVREALRASDPTLPVFDVMSMDEVRAISYWSYQLFSWTFGIFGGVALFLALIGVYGVISYGVSQRRREIGVRIALGARGRDVLRLVVGHGVGLALAGVGLGLLGALGVTRVLTSILYRVSPSDPLSFAGTALALIATAAAASYAPARRATRVDPMVALRED